MNWKAPPTKYENGGYRVPLKGYAEIGEMEAEMVPRETKEEIGPNVDSSIVPWKLASHLLVFDATKEAAHPTVPVYIEMTEK